MDFHQYGHQPPPPPPQQQQQQRMSSGLTRYRSAPSSYFASHLADFSTANTDIVTINNSHSHGSGSGMDDLDQFLNRFLPNDNTNNTTTTTAHDQVQQILLPRTSGMHMQSQITEFVKQEEQEQDYNSTTTHHHLHHDDVHVHQNMQTDYSQVAAAGSQMMMYQNQTPPAMNASSPSSSSMECYSNNRVFVSSNHQFGVPMKMATGGGGGNNSSNLVRYNSSPAGLFANVDTHNEYGSMSGATNMIITGGGATGGDNKGFSSSSVITGGGGGGGGSGSFANNNNNNSSWEDDSTLLSDTTFLKALADDDLLINNDDYYNNNKNQNNKATTSSSIGNSSSSSSSAMLSRHMSLPIPTTNKVDNNLSAMETLMQDSVICKIRAKRGCATHPRSIAERVRRTRISERMRKLQELVPNMEKQTNTSDMLDLAVDYIKDLQEQVKTLSDNRAKCRCSNE